MKWYKHLYIGNNAYKNKDSIIWKIKHHAGQLHIYVICLASNENNLLDIIPSYELLQSYYKSQTINIIGIAKGWEEAAMLVAHIVDETYQKTGNTDVGEFIKQQEMV